MRPTELAKESNRRDRQRLELYEAFTGQLLELDDATLCAADVEILIRAV